jgi:glycosyltransferase involved in cell wall biosynthesis
MKVLIDGTPLRGQGGVPNYVYHLTQNLLDQNPDVFFSIIDYPRLYFGKNLLPFPSTNYELVPMVNCCHKWSCTGRNWLAKAWHRLLKKLENYPDLAYCQKVAHELGPYDIFHLHEYFLAVAPRTPMVATVHDLSCRTRPQDHVAENIAAHAQKMAYIKRHAQGIIAVSQATADDLVKFQKIPAHKITVIGEACRPQISYRTKTQAAALLAQLGLKPRQYLLSVATLEPRKNIDGVLAAFARLKKQKKHVHLKLVLAGMLGWKYQKLWQKIKDHPDKADIIYTGFVTDRQLSALYSHCLVFLYLSHYEGFGLPVLEAMTCGSVTVSSNTSSLPEVAGKKGLLFAPDDLDAIVKVLSKLVVDKKYWQDRQRYCQKQAQKFSWFKTAAKTWAYYKKILKH